VVPPLDSALVGKLLGEGSASAAAVRDWADAWRAGAADPRSFAASRLVLLSDPQGGGAAARLLPCPGHAHGMFETCPAGDAAAQLLRSLRGLASRGGVREATARYGEIWGVWGDMGDMGGVREATASASKTGNAGGTAISFVGVLEMTVEDCAAAAAAAADAGAAADGGPCQQRLERHLASATAARSPSLVLVRGAERCDGDGCFDAALEILERRDIARGCPRLADIAGGTGDRSKRVRPRTANG